MRFDGHAAVGLGVGLILGPFSASASKPAVTLVQASPVVVAGSGYTAGARFVVSYHSGATQARRRVTANVAGRFRVAFRGVTFKRCNGLQLAAAGASMRVASCAVGGHPSVNAQPGGPVTGSAFVPTEHVALSARAGEVVVRTSAKAGRNGVFTAQLPWPRQGCTDIAVRAIGALGSTAAFTVAMPDCKKPEAAAAIVALTLLHGTVRIGPTSPVCRVDVPCSKPAARVLLMFNHGRTRVQVRTDALGRYRARLVPGTWTLTTRLGMPATPTRFTVPRTLSARRDFLIDTGIR